MYIVLKVFEGSFVYNILIGNKMGEFLKLFCVMIIIIKFEWFILFCVFIYFINYEKLFYFY